jgi:hypothetical protein
MPDQEKPREFEGAELTPTEQIEAPPFDNVSEEPQEAETPVCAPANKCLMRAAAVSIAIVCFVAVLVAGFIQLGARWREPSANKAPISGPAGVLWQEMNSEKSVPGSLGLPAKMKNEAGFKTGQTPSDSQ